jgi:hypothetical protein
MTSVSTQAKVAMRLTGYAGEEGLFIDPKTSQRRTQQPCSTKVGSCAVEWSRYATGVTKASRVASGHHPSSELAMTDDLISPSDGSSAAHTRVVRRHDRLIDALAVLLLGAGVMLFGIGRHALSALGNGTYQAPRGVSWVSRADFHAAQTHWGLWLVASGVAVALIAAFRHRRITTDGQVGR